MKNEGKRREKEGEKRGLSKSKKIQAQAGQQPVKKAGSRFYFLFLPPKGSHGALLQWNNRIYACSILYV